MELAEEIIKGRRITKDDDLSIFLTCDLDELRAGADKIREYFIGEDVDLCSIINGRSGRCPEDCKFCAQSAHNHTNCEVYDFLDEEKIMEACRFNEEHGVHRFSIVTSGRALTGEEFEKAIHAFERMHNECKIDLCASMGFLTPEQLHRLHEAGVTSYHHNIETSRRNFPNICTTHTYDQKIETLKAVKAEGMCPCSGGIIGMGETWEDRLSMAVDLAEAGVESIPINALMPIKGTPLEDRESLTEDDILRTIAFFRYINPEANIRLAAGRALLTNDGEIAFQSGASATITGDMLTTVACAISPVADTFGSAASACCSVDADSLAATTSDTSCFLEEIPLRTNATINTSMATQIHKQNNSFARCFLLLRRRSSSFRFFNFFLRSSSRCCSCNIVRLLMTSESSEIIPTFPFVSFRLYLSLYLSYSIFMHTPFINFP